jgi:MtN3 and saliva related transmembrane protein
MSITILGLAAGILTSAAIVPQLLKTFRSRKARDISIWQPLILNAGMVLWLLYGIFIHDLPLIVANSFSIICNSLLIAMKILFRNEDDKGVSRDYSYEQTSQVEGSS